MADLIIASKNGYYNKVKELLDTGFSVRVRDRDNATALYWGACRGHAPICAALVQAGADINARVKWGSTALHACADRGHLDCVKTLVTFGADLTLQNVRGDTPLHLAGYRGYADIVTTLLEARANPNLLNEKKKTAEQEARGQGHIRVANILQSCTQGQAVLSTDGVSEELGRGKHNPDTHYSAEIHASNLTTNVKSTENKENLQFQWNDLDQSAAENDLSRLNKETSHTEKPLSLSRRRRGSVPQTLLRSPIEPQESEEPCSASSWDGTSPVDSSPLHMDEFAIMNNNAKQAFSDVLAQKRLRRPVSVGYMPQSTASPFFVNNTPYMIDRVETASNQSANTSELADVFQNSKWRHPLGDSPVFESPGVRVPFMPGNQSNVSSSTNQTSGSKTNADLQRRLEELSRYAENLQFKLVGSLEKMQELSKSNQEKQTLLEHYAAEHESDKKARRTLETENEGLAEEVKRLKDKLQCIQSDQLANHSPVHRHSSAENLKPNEPSVVRSRQPSYSPPAALVTPLDHGSETVAMDTGSPSPQHNNNNDDKIRPPDTTHINILHALKICVGDKVLTDHHLHQLNLRFRNLLRAKWTGACPQRQLLDRTNREWSLGEDFHLLDNKPVNQKEGGHREGSCSLIFRISHRSKVYILKMMINLIDMASSGHGNGQSMPRFLSRHFGAEYDIPLRLSPHDNIVQICHFYEGSTRRFRNFLPFLVPPSLDVPLDMANRTTFMVMPEYPMTLKDLMVDLRTKTPEPPFGLSGNFLLLLLYQLLSAVDHLVQNGVVHRDIKAENVLLDNRLRPVIGDFGFARRFHEHNGKKMMFTSSEQVFAGNSNAWAPELARLNRDGPESLPQMASLAEVYQKADAYAVSRMFYSLLRPLEEVDDFPFSSMSVPHYEESDIPALPACLSPSLTYILRQLVLDQPRDRPSARQAMVLVGMVMAGPGHGEVNTAGEFMTFYQAKLLQHLASARQLRCPLPDGVLSMTQSVQQNLPDLELHMLTHATPQEMWDSCKLLKQIRLTS